jgi:hypothetical protein
MFGNRHPVAILGVIAAVAAVAAAIGLTAL